MTAPSLLLAAALARPAAVPGAPADLDFLICQAVREQQDLEVRWRQFEYQKDDVQEKMDEGKVTSRERVTRYIHRSRPDGIAVNQIVARNGRPLAVAEAREQEAKAADRRRRLDGDPQELQHAVAKARKDSAEKVATMEGMNGAFRLRLEGFEWYGDEPCWVVSFTPDPSYRPARKEHSYFQKFQGIAFVRVEEPAFVRIELDVIEGLSLKYGPFATLTPGSHVFLTQGEVLPGVFMTLATELDLRLRIFFMFRREERRGTYYRDFKRANPARRTLAP